jgi:Ribbon-helix-helix protein, copG family
MKRLQIVIDEDLDEALGAEALRERVSKAELLRRYARMQLAPLPPIEEDPLWEMVGADDGRPTDSKDVDEVVY